VPISKAMYEIFVRRNKSLQKDASNRISKSANKVAGFNVNQWLDDILFNKNEIK
jgi:phage host-nuclease inhibitor protein Gam